jgi:beta-N-acetylhexosaminidase
MKPIIFGLSGPSLTNEERELFVDADPAGYILFRPNTADPAQVRALTDDLRSLSGRNDLPILIDQEGGTVQRMGPPHWPSSPSASVFAAAYAKAPMTAIEAARLQGLAIGLMLHEVGITVNCAPVLDRAGPDTHADILARSFGPDPVQIASLGKAMLDGMASAGVVGLLKHMPGLGRASVDSHHDLPAVANSAEELGADFEAFRLLRSTPIGMVGHVKYEALDASEPASRSSIIIQSIIRGQIGFDGLLLSDDLTMNALTGTLADRSVAAIEAGCDVALACWGTLNEKAAAAAALSEMSDQSRARLDRAMASAKPAITVDSLAAVIAKRDALLSYTA